MTTITKERVQQKIKKLEFAISQSAFTSIRDGLEEELEMARMLLAVMEQEPVFLLNNFLSRLQRFLDEGDFVGDERGVISGAIGCGKEILSNYAAPQPARVVPDEWIPCSERMPGTEDVLVFCSNTKEQMVGFHKGNRLFQFFYMNGVEGACEPTHWMPLPAAPKP